MVPLDTSPARGSGQEEAGDGFGSDLLGGNYLRERAIRGSASKQGPIGTPDNSAFQQALDEVRAEFREQSEARADETWKSLARGSKMLA